MSAPATFSLRLVCAPRGAAGEGSDPRFMQGLAAWLHAGVRECGPQRLVMTLEAIDCPTLCVGELARLCKRIRDHIGPLLPLDFVVSTNPAGLSNEWVHLMALLSARVVVDLDAVLSRHQCSAAHPALPADVVAGIRLLQRASAHDLFNPPQARMTLGMPGKAAAWFGYLVSQLDLHDIDLVLPPERVHLSDPQRTMELEQQLAAVVEAWTGLGHPGVTVAMFDHFFDRLAREMAHPARSADEAQDLSIVMTMDGRFTRADGLATIAPPADRASIFDTGLAAYLGQARQGGSAPAQRRIDPACHECAWVGYCRGGRQSAGLINHDSRADGVVHKSRYCNGLDALFDRLARHMIGLGASPDGLLEALLRLRSNALPN